MFFKVLADQALEAHPTQTRKSNFSKSHLEVLMFNVDRGEAILLVFPGKRAWLIDSGCRNHPTPNGKLGNALAQHLVDHDLTLEVIIPTHPHIDHGGAFKTILESSAKKTTPVTMYRAKDAWSATSGWKKDLLDVSANVLKQVVVSDGHREVPILDEVEAHLFAGSGAGVYTSVFVHLRYHEARLLFTGDAEKEYERELLETFGPQDFRADLLKVTHHGSSGGTDETVLSEIRPGIAIASTANHDTHRLEQDTKDHINAGSAHVQIFETLAKGDIMIRTDGLTFGDGVLYEAVFDNVPGRFAGVLDAEVIP